MASQSSLQPIPPQPRRTPSGELPVVRPDVSGMLAHDLRRPVDHRAQPRVRARRSRAPAVRGGAKRARGLPDGQRPRGPHRIRDGGGLAPRPRRAEPERLRRRRREPRPPGRGRSRRGDDDRRGPALAPRGAHAVPRHDRPHRARPRAPAHVGHAPRPVPGEQSISISGTWSLPCASGRAFAARRSRPTPRATRSPSTSPSPSCCRRAAGCGARPRPTGLCWSQSRCRPRRLASFARSLRDRGVGLAQNTRSIPRSVSARIRQPSARCATP